MSIMARVINIFKADIHGVMDQFEDQGLLLKQHLRDMQAALNQKEDRLNTMMAVLRQAQNECNRYQHQSDVLERDIAVAIRKSKDGVARKLIRRLKPINVMVENLTGQIRILEEDISNTKIDLDQQRLQYEQIKYKSAEFFRRSRLQTRSHDLPSTELESLYADLSEEEVELELLKRKEELGAA